MKPELFDRIEVCKTQISKKEEIYAKKCEDKRIQIKIKKERKKSKLLGDDKHCRLVMKIDNDKQRVW